MVKNAILIFLFTCSTVYGQQILTTTIESDYLENSRDVRIYIPKSYELDSVKSYPLAIVFDAEFKENEKKMKEDWKVQAAEMLENAGCKDVNIYDSNAPIGKGIHEMGTARMGRDPKTSVLNKYNQVHSVPNVFVTDGAFMASSGTQNPSLTYMAFTARAVNHAVSELKKMNL